MYVLVKWKIYALCTIHSNVSVVAAKPQKVIYMYKTIVKYIFVSLKKPNSINFRWVKNPINLFWSGLKKMIKVIYKKIPNEINHQMGEKPNEENLICSSEKLTQICSKRL